MNTQAFWLDIQFFYFFFFLFHEHGFILGLLKNKSEKEKKNEITNLFKDYSKKNKR